MENKAKITMQEIVGRLNDINKDELSERQFFQAVLSVIKDMKDFELTEKDFEQLSSTMKQIGCVDYNTWKKEKEDLGFPMELKRNELGIQEGLLSTAERYVDQYLSDYGRAKYALGLMTEERGKPSWVQRWLENSQKVMRELKENSDQEFEFYEPELKKNGQLSGRPKEEKEVKEAPLKKEQLMVEINAIKEQINKLEIEEATLRNSKIRKELELNDLGEK